MSILVEPKCLITYKYNVLFCKNACKNLEFCL